MYRADIPFLIVLQLIVPFNPSFKDRQAFIKLFILVFGKFSGAIQIKDPKTGLLANP